jgi:hypothetical protein
MFTDNIEQIKKSKWLSISIQSSLLGLNVILASQKVYNSFLLLSIVVLFSLFLLQAASHRFLYFNPFNYHVQRAVPHFDTYILYFFIYLAGFLFVLGITHEYKVEPLNVIEGYLKSKILWSYLIFLFLFPMCWKVFGRKLIAKSIAKELRDNSFQYTKNCDECGRDGVLHKNIVISWNDLRIQRECPNCDKGRTKEFRTTLRIG